MKTTSLFTLFLLGFIFVSTVVKANNRGGECTPRRGKNVCGSLRKCVKKAGGWQYHCVCKSGYKGNGIFCKDVDECKEKKYRLKCKYVGGTCKNTRGSFQCKCLQGFEMHSSKHICQDRNECEEFGMCHEKATCHNTRGSYRCKCKKGFAGDGEVCVEDIAYQQEKDKQLILTIGGAVGGGVLLIVALIAFCCCTKKRKKKGEEEGIEGMESTLSRYGNDWESSSDSDLSD